MSCISNSLRTVVPVVSMPTYVSKESDFSKRCSKVFATALLGCLAVGGIAFGSSYGFYRLYKAANVASQLRDLSRAAMGISATIGVVAIAFHILRGSCTGISAYHSHRRAEDFGKGSGPRVPLGSGHSNPSPHYTPPVNHKKVLDEAAALARKLFFEKIKAFFEGEITREGVQTQREALQAMQMLSSNEQFQKEIQYVEKLLDLCDEYLDLEEDVQALEQGTTEEQKRSYQDRLDSIMNKHIQTKAPSLVLMQDMGINPCLAKFYKKIATMIKALPVVEEGKGDNQNNHNASPTIHKLREKHKKGRILTAEDEAEMDEFMQKLSEKGSDVSYVFNNHKASGSESGDEGGNESSEEGFGLFE